MQTSVTFEELSGDDKVTIYNWLWNKEATKFIKIHSLNLFKKYTKDKSEIVDPVRFKIQSGGSILGSDISYVLSQTNLLTKISGQRMLISGLDMQQQSDHQQRGAFISNLSDNNNCPLCSYKYDTQHDESKQQKNDNISPPSSFCKQCCDSTYGLFTVWTSLDYFDTPFNAGSILFCLGSHNKFRGYRHAIMNNRSVPKEYVNSTTKSTTIWGYVNHIKPGDQFIFNIKTLHASSKARDGYLRARFDFKIAVKPSLKRYIEELKEIKSVSSSTSSSHLGLSQSSENAPPNKKDKGKDYNDNDNEEKDDDEEITQTQPLSGISSCSSDDDDELSTS